MGITTEHLHEGIREDGTVDDPYQGVETYYLALEGIAEVHVEDDGYFRVTADDGGTNVEVRIPFSALTENGWVRPKRSESDADDEDEDEDEDDL